MRCLAVIYLFFYSAIVVAVGAHPEDRLLDAVHHIQGSKLAQAEQELKSLLVDRPNFKLAQLVYADVLKAKTGVVKQLGLGLSDTDDKVLLLSEIKNRYKASTDKKIVQKYPAVLARLDNNYNYALVIDLSKSRLYVFENTASKPSLVEDFFVSMGRAGSGKVNEGDLKTPMGVYFVQSYISATQLEDKYGAGAYPINYPNAWDRINGKTGHGIWLHGTRSGTYNRPVLASEGCVVLPNDDLIEVGSYIDLKSTPVLIGENLQWLSEEEWSTHQALVNQIHLQWKSDWESLDVEEYLSHYSKRFTNGKKKFSHWADHKRRVSKHKTFVQVDLSNVSLLMHPNEDVMVATFQQSYSSDNFTSQSWKRQYWNKEPDGEWRIVFEDEITPPASPQLARNTL
jgi:murein L,D-transpeptidase YafK